jgi:hypothetical protein
MYSLCNEIEQYEKLMKLRELIGLTKDWHVGIKQEKDKIFEDVVGYDDIKKIFRMALEVWNIILPKFLLLSTCVMVVLVLSLSSKLRYIIISSPILNVVNVSSFDPPYTIFKPGILE